MKEGVKNFGKKCGRNIGRAGAWTLEKAISELALPAAIMSTTNSGNYLERGVAGITTTAKIIVGGIGAYVHNAGVRDVVNGFGLTVIREMGNAAGNIQDDPEKVLYAALGTYATCKTIPYVSKTIRKRLRERRLKSQIQR